MPKGIPRDQSTQRTVLHRLKIARGHLDKVIDMVTNDHYCIDIIHQSHAVRAAIRQADEILLKNHLETCVAHEAKKGHGHDMVEEVMKVWTKQSSLS